MVKLKSLINYTNSFITVDETSVDDFVEYEVVESDDPRKPRYHYHRINFIKNNETLKGSEHYRNTVYRTHESIDLGTFNNWVDDVIRLNYKRFIVPCTDTERSIMVIIHNMPLFMHLTKVAYFVRVTLPFRKYNLDYSENEYWFDLVNGVLANEYHRLLTNPAIYRQTGKSLLTKSMFNSIMDRLDGSQDIPMVRGLTKSLSDIADVDISELYPETVGSFSK